MSYVQYNILDFKFVIDPSWSHSEIYSEFKKAIQNLDYLNNGDIKPFLQAKTFKDVLVTERRFEKLSLCMLIAHLTNGCYSLHQGLRKNNLIKLHIKIEFYQESSINSIKYKSCTCIEEIINKMEYFLSTELGNISSKYDK